MDKLLQFFIVLVNSTLKNGSHLEGNFDRISSNNYMFIF